MSYDTFLDREYEDHCEAQRVADRASILQQVRALHGNIDEACKYYDGYQADIASGKLDLIQQVEALEALEDLREEIADWSERIADLEEELRFI